MLLGPLLASALLGAPAAPAERPAVEFRWDAPAGCPDEAAVVAELEALLGAPLAERRGRRLTAIARVRQEPGGGFDLRLWTVGDEGTLHRSLTNERCDMLARAGVLIAAMAIDPLALERMPDGEAVAAVAAEATPVPASEPPPAPASDPPAPAPASEPPAPAATPTRPPAPAPARRLRGALRFAGGLGYGDLPGVGGTLRLTPALVWPRVRVELEALYMPVHRARFDDRPDVGVDLQLAAAAVRGCPVFRRGIVELPICAGLEVGAMYGRGVGLPLTDDGRLPWAALHLTPALLLVPHRRVAVFFAVEGVVALVRPRFVIEEVGAIYRAGGGAVRALVGVEARFP
ncbi:MAG: hypothetical protein JNL82_05410 [Myxococcales bacterium]|nr:hypothetical protein [Myxococcales bacterium]